MAHETVYLVSTRYPSIASIKRELAQGTPISVTTMSAFDRGAVSDGRHPLCGPTPSNRKWFATVEIKDEKIVKVCK